MRTITAAKWIPDIPSPDEVDRMVEEAGVEVMSIENFNMVSVRPEKRIDWEKVWIIAAAILPMATCLACTELMRDHPLTFACFGVASLVWNALVMAVNIKRKSRPSGM